MVNPALAIDFKTVNEPAEPSLAPAGSLAIVESGRENPKVNILVVDDTPENLVALEAVLSQLSQNLIKARSGEEALRLLLKQEFAVILLDVNMPGLNGFETAELIRQRKSTEHIPIIFVSAISTSDTHLFKGYALGAVDYIFTPVIPEVLRSKVTVFVELLKKTEEVRHQAERLRQHEEREHQVRMNEAARRIELQTKHNAELQAEIATRKRTEQALQESNSALEAFSYSVSHDLRAPIRAMQGFAKALLEDYGSVLNETGKECAQRIVNASERMDTLVHDLLVFSRLGHTELDLKPISLHEAVLETIVSLEHDLKAKGATIDVSEPLPTVVAHETTLTQVLTNLISNGTKFMAPGVKPHLKISAEQDGPFATIFVKDNGIGISPENQERIFRVFERLHGADDYPGTGLGLAIVKKGVDRMHGQVGVESRLGEGSRFWIRLPLKSRDGAA